MPPSLNFRQSEDNGLPGEPDMAGDIVIGWVEFTFPGFVHIDTPIRGDAGFYMVNDSATSVITGLPIMIGRR